MRSENIGNQINVASANLQGYHQGGYGESYAFRGFNSNKYFTSDRFIKLDDNFKRADNKPLKGYGLEIETGWNYSSCRDRVAQNIVANIVTNAIYPLFPADLFKMQEDCTITGVEMITQVMTKEFIRNNGASFKAMWDNIFPNFGMTTDDGHCGMHVNLSVGLFGTTEKKQEEGVRKLFYIINKHYNFFKVALYRTGSTGWCNRMNYDNAKTMDVHHMDSSHGNCFNGSHFDAGRVEIRLVGGQKNYACFRNTMEVIFHIVEAIKVLNWNDLDDLAKVFSGCNNYVFDRLSTNCYRAGVISSDDIEKIRPTVKRVQYI